MKKGMTCFMSLLIYLLGVAHLAALAAPDLNYGLLLHYSFDQPGHEVKDLSGHNRHGKVVGGKWVPDGVLGGAMYLAGPQHRVETSDAGFPEGDSPRSFSWWFAIDELRPNFCTDFMYYGRISNNQANILGLDWRHGRDCPSFSQWGGVYLSGRRIDEVLTWYHLVFTYAGNGRYKYYINGEHWHGHSELRGPINTRLGGVFAIGSYRPDVVNSLGGFIDEVRVYDRVLTISEVETLYRQGMRKAGQPVALNSLHIAGVKAQEGVDSVFSAKTEDVVGPANSSLSDSQGAVPSRGIATSGREAVKGSTPYVLTVGFSDRIDGEQDVTVFYPGETLYVRIVDVDVALWYEDVKFSIILYQTSTESDESIVATALLESDDHHVFQGQVNLERFQSGTVLVNIMAVNAAHQEIVFFRSAWIIIKDDP